MRMDGAVLPLRAPEVFLSEMSLLLSFVTTPPAVRTWKLTSRPPAIALAAAASGLAAFFVMIAWRRVLKSSLDVTGICASLKKVPPFDSGIVMPVMTRLATELLVISTFVSEAASSLPEPSRASARTMIPPAPAENGLTVMAWTCL